MSCSDKIQETAVFGKLHGIHAALKAFRRDVLEKHKVLRKFGPTFVFA